MVSIKLKSTINSPVRFQQNCHKQKKRKLAIMIKVIEDHWELYSQEEFTLRKSLLDDHVKLFQDQEADWVQKVIMKIVRRKNDLAYYRFSDYAIIFLIHFFEKKIPQNPDNHFIDYQACAERTLSHA